MLELKEKGVPGGEGTANMSDHTGRDAGGSVKNGSKNRSLFVHDEGTILGV